MKFPLAVIDEVNRVTKEHGKDDFIVGYRFSPEEIENPGITLDDTLKLVDVLADQALSYLHVSINDFWQSSTREKEDKLPIVPKIISTINGRLPFIGVGGIHTPEEAVKALESGADVWQNDIIDEDKSQRYVYDSEGLHLIEEKPSENMGDTQTLIDFLEFSKENYPANSIENYGGNTRKQGFTNMADLGHLVKKSASLLPESYKDVISALEACIL